MKKSQVIFILGVSILLQSCALFSKREMDVKQYQYHAYVLAMIELCGDAGYFSKSGASSASSDFMRGAFYIYKIDINALFDLKRRTKPLYSADDERCAQVAQIAHNNGRFADSYSNSLDQFNSNSQNSSRKYYNTSCLTTGPLTRCSTY